MCLLCIEVAKGKMTVREIGRALMELDMDEDHSETFTEIYTEKYNLDELIDVILHDKKESFLTITNFSDYDSTFFPYVDDWNWEE